MLHPHRGWLRPAPLLASLATICLLRVGAPAHAQGATASATPPQRELYVQDATISPDGKLVAFSRYEATGPYDDDHWTLWVAERDGSPPTGAAARGLRRVLPRRATAGGGDARRRRLGAGDRAHRRRRPATDHASRRRGRGAELAPDGKSLVYTAKVDGNLDLYEVAATGGTPRRLTSDPAADYNPRVSPDGKRIVEPALYSGYPEVSPDSRRVVFLSNRDGAEDLYVMPAEGGAATRLTSTAELEGDPRWSADGRDIRFAGFAERAASADGKRLAFQTSAKGKPGHLWVLDLASGAVRKLAPHEQPYDDECPSWFPDGRHLAFQSDRSGRMEVWVMAADGSAARQLTGLR